jgi:ankyrin repeat protein
MAASYLGLETVVQILLKEEPDVNIETEDDRGRTLLLWAAEKGHEAVVQQLQSHLTQPSL